MIFRRRRTVSALPSAVASAASTDASDASSAFSAAQATWPSGRHSYRRPAVRVTSGTRFPPAVALSREEIVEWLGPTVQRYLTAPRP